MTTDPDYMKVEDWDDLYSRVIERYIKIPKDYTTASTSPFKDYAAVEDFTFMPDVIRKKLSIISHNRKQQLKWDKIFNQKVLELVRRAIDYGEVTFRIATIEPFKIFAKDELVIPPKYQTFHIFYDSTLPEPMAYIRCREQAEEAVRRALPPPNLI